MERKPGNRIFLQYEEHSGFHEWLWSEDMISPDDIEYRKVVRMDCSHPRGCVVSASHVEDVMTTNHCGWCAAEQRAVEAEAKLAEARDVLAAVQWSGRETPTCPYCWRKGMEGHARNCKLAIVLRGGEGAAAPFTPAQEFGD